MAGLKMAPFDKDGNLQQGVYRYNVNNMVWVPNDPFKASLIYTGYGPTSSSVKLYFETEDGRQFSMFMSDFDKLLESVTLVMGKTPELVWHVVKRGSAYGLAML